MDSEFHADGLANEKALLPYVDVVGCGTSSCPLTVERTRLSLDYRNSWYRFIAFGAMPLVNVDREHELDVF